MGTPFNAITEAMRGWSKRYVAIGMVLFLAAIILMFRQPNRAHEIKTSSATPTNRHPPKSLRTLDSRGTGRTVRTSLTGWPSVVISGVYLQSGFVLLKPDTLTVAKGEIGYIHGIARNEVWIRVSSADDRFLIAELEGESTSMVRPGDRVIFPAAR